MRRAPLFLSVLVAVGLATAWAPTEARCEQAARIVDAPAKSGVAEEVSSLNRQFWDAIAARDLWAQGQIWDKENPSISAIFPAAATPAIGWGNVSESFRRIYSHNRDIKIDARVIHTYQTDDLVWLVSVVRFEAVQTQTGQPILMNSMLTTEVFARRNGGWKMVHYHGHNPSFLVPREGPEKMTVNVTVPKRAPSTVWPAYDKFNAAFQGRDLAAMFELLEPQGKVAALHPTSHVPFIGLENVLASWKKTFADIESLTSDTQVLELSETASAGWITELAQYHIVFKDSPNEVRHFHNVMTTFIFVKHGEEWRLAHYHAHLGFSFDEHAH